MTNLHIITDAKMSGRIAGIEIRRNGRLHKYHPGTPNLILDNGKYAFLHNGILPSFGAIRLGTSSTAVNASQTALVALSKSSDNWIYGPSPDGYEYHGTRYDEATGQVFYRKTVEFPAETGSFTYREVGVAPSTSGTTVYTRVTPTAITGVAGDIVRITYEIGAQITSAASILNNSQFISGWNTAGTNRLEGYFQDSYSWTDDRGYEGMDHIVPHLSIYDDITRAGIYGLPFDPVSDGRPTLFTDLEAPPHASTWGYEVPWQALSYPLPAISADTVSFGTNTVIYTNSFNNDFQPDPITVSGLHWRGLYIRFTTPQVKSTSMKLNLTMTRTVT